MPLRYPQQVSPSRYHIIDLGSISRNYAHSIFNNLKSEIYKNKNREDGIVLPLRKMECIYKKRPLGYVDYLDKQSVKTCYKSVRDFNILQIALYSRFTWV